MQEHDWSRSCLRVPSCRDAYEIIQTVLGAKTHVPSVHEVPFEDDVRERDEGVPNERPLVNLDGIHVEKERTGVRIRPFGKGHSSTLLNQFEDFLEDFPVRFWEGMRFRDMDVEDSPVQPCIDFGLVDVRPGYFTEPSGDK